MPPRSPQEALLLGALMPNPSWDLSGPSEHRSWTQSGSCLVLREPQPHQWPVKPSAMQDVQMRFPLSAALCMSRTYQLWAQFSSESSSVQFPGWQQYPNSRRGAGCRGGKTICDWKVNWNLCPAPSPPWLCGCPLLSVTSGFRNKVSVPQTGRLKGQMLFSHSPEVRNLR